jgi:hypothetical protein
MQIAVRASCREIIQRFFPAVLAWNNVLDRRSGYIKAERQ